MSQNYDVGQLQPGRQFSSHKDDDEEKKELDQLEKDLKMIAKKEPNQFWAHWIKELQSPPNVITTTRILFAPVLSYFIISGQHHFALYGCVAAGASDWLDGYLARNHNMSTVLGAFLDPMADKIIINVLSVSLWYTEILPTPLVGLWFAKDFLLVFGCAAYVRMQSKDASMAYDPVSTPLKVLPTQTSKINTALQFVTLGVGIVYPLYNIPPEVFSGLW
jgi:cardiolipin synthase